MASARQDVRDVCGAALLGGVVRLIEFLLALLFMPWRIAMLAWGVR